MSLDMLTVLKEYGLAGVLAWLFYWTLRRMMLSHDATVRGLREQLETQTEIFTQTVQNHLAHANDALVRVEGALAHGLEEARHWQGRLLQTLEKIETRLARRSEQ